MFKFFRFITKIITFIIDFVVNFFKMLIFALGFIAQGVTYVFTIIMYLPPWVLPFVTAVIAWCIILFILNRE